MKDDMGRTPLDAASGNGGGRGGAGTEEVRTLLGTQLRNRTDRPPKSSKPSNWVSRRETARYLPLSFFNSSTRSRKAFSEESTSAL